MGARPTRQKIHSHLREQILLLDLPPGARLGEERLANQFGVSRTPIRQVLDRLEFEGLVELGNGAGARVSALDPKALRDIWAVRLRVAKLVADFVVLPASDQVIERVTSIRSGLDTVRDTRDKRTLGALYNRFHEAMLDVVTNVALVKVHDLLYVQTARVWMQFLPEMDLDREIDAMAEEVDKVLVALEGTAGADLAQIRADHMSGLLQRFNEHVTSFPPIPV